MAKELAKSAVISDVQFDRSFYRPGEVVHVVISIKNENQNSQQVRLLSEISYLSNVVDGFEQMITLDGGAPSINLSWAPPPEAPKGYGIDISIFSTEGERLDNVSKAFDVLNTWVDAPRYGFLSDFYPGRENTAQTMQKIARFHINGLQFYDWMYRHEQFLTDEEPYRDILNRELSLVTVHELISAAHAQNIAAMPYTAIYAASIPFYEQHPDWALFGHDRKPLFFGENFLVYMDPRPGSPWVNHLLKQFEQVLVEVPFDGIHLDQYGDPKRGYDMMGNSFNLAQALADTINLTKELVLEHQQDGVVVFNAVANWPIESVAPSKQDLVYIEVWPPYRWFDDLHTLIIQAQTLSGGKPVVLAAYIDPALEHNVRLMDAIIFASGGSHIELGEGNAMLADPYFPNYKVMSPELAEQLERYYDFMVRYQNIIGPRTHDATSKYANKIHIDDVSTSPSQRKNKVWPIVRESEGYLAVNLINFLGIETVEWEKAIRQAPSPLGRTEVRIEGLEKDVAGVWFATPDELNFTLIPLEFTLGDHNSVIIEISSLKYWDLIVIESIG